VDLSPKLAPHDSRSWAGAGRRRGGHGRFTTARSTPRWRATGRGITPKPAKPSIRVLRGA